MFIETNAIFKFVSPFMGGQKHIALLTELTKFLLPRVSINIAPLRG